MRPFRRPTIIKLRKLPKYFTKLLGLEVGLTLNFFYGKNKLAKRKDGKFINPCKIYTIPTTISETLNKPPKRRLRMSYFRKTTILRLRRLPENFTKQEGIDVGFSNSFFHWKCPLVYNYDTKTFKNPYFIKHSVVLPIEKIDEILILPIPQPSNIPFTPSKLDIEFVNKLEFGPKIPTVVYLPNYKLTYGYLNDLYMICKLYYTGEVVLIGNDFLIKSTSSRFKNKFITSNKKVNHKMSYYIGQQLLHAIHGKVKVCCLTLYSIAIRVNNTLLWYSFDGLQLKDLASAITGSMIR